MKGEKSNSLHSRFIMYLDINAMQFLNLGSIFYIGLLCFAEKVKLLVEFVYQIHIK